MAKPPWPRLGGFGMRRPVDGAATENGPPGSGLAVFSHARSGAACIGTATVPSIVAMDALHALVPLLRLDR